MIDGDAVPYPCRSAWAQQPRGTDLGQDGDDNGTHKTNTKYFSQDSPCRRRVPVTFRCRCEQRQCLEGSDGPNENSMVQKLEVKSLGLCKRPTLCPF